MTALLAFDTASPVLGVGLWVDGEIRERSCRAGRGSEERLLPFAVELLAEAGLTVAALSAVAAAAGPGAFTGLRVGLATAAGLAQAVGCPVVTAGSLDHRWRAVRETVEVDDILVMLDARKQRVYAALWRRNTCVQAPQDVPPEVATRWAQGPFVATGEGARVYEAVVQSHCGQVAPDAENPAVGHLAAWAAEAWRGGAGIAPEEVRPAYLRAPDAVRKS